MASTPLNAFIVALPKAELHLHLEGSIDPPTVLELKRRHGKTGTLAEVEQLYRFKDFTGFLMAFKTVTEELQTPEDYELITYRLMEKLKADNVLHAEVYVSVGVCLWRKQDFDSIFKGMERGRERGEGLRARHWNLCLTVTSSRALRSRVSVCAANVVLRTSILYFPGSSLRDFIGGVTPRDLPFT